MGFSASAATVVLFVGILVGFGTFFSAVEDTGDRLAQSTDAAADRAVAIHNTDIAVENVSYDDATATLTVTAENTGARALDVRAVTLLVDGRYAAVDRTAVDGVEENDVFAPGQRLELTVTPTDDPDRVKVVTGAGVAATETGV
jgi:flagellar protein FlaF